MTDKIKLAVALLIAIAGVVGYYLLADQLQAVRILVVLVAILLGLVVFWFTEPGKQFYAFTQESWGEARKVVWPTRKETLQTTGVVIALVVVMAIFLWFVDWILNSIVEQFIRGA